MARLPAFELERHFAKYEAAERDMTLYTLCSSDTESISLQEALALADDECRQKWEELSLGYTDVKGHPDLLQELSKAYQADHAEFGGSTAQQPPALDPGHHIQELVPSEAILLSMLALVRPGDHVVTMAPAYQSLSAVATAAGATVSLWKPHEHDDGSVHFDIDELEALLRSSNARPRVVTVNFPHNPTGFNPSREDWQRLISLCREHGSFLFCDEIYRGLERNPANEQLPPACTAYPERGISMGALSKALGMPGVRIGWLASYNHEFLQAVGGLRDWTTNCSSAPSQVLALIAVRERQQLLERSRRIMESGRAAVGAAIAARPHLLSWGSGPVAGPMGWVRLARADASATAYSDQLVNTSAIVVLPSSVYAHTGDRYIRIGFGRADTVENVARWERTLDDERHPATMLLHGR